MTYEKMTDMIDLDELEVEAEEVTEVSGGFLSGELRSVNRQMFLDICIA